MKIQSENLHVCNAIPYFLLVEMISRLPLSCLRPSLLKQSVRSVNATVATSARGRGSNISKGWLQTDFSEFKLPVIKENVLL